MARTWREPVSSSFTQSFTQADSAEAAASPREGGSANLRPGEYAMRLQAGPNVDGVDDCVNECDGMTICLRPGSFLTPADAPERLPTE